ncbi:MAG: hypothetical protein ACK51F_21125 [Rhodospirillales bacterium]|jgi:hypothetical protein
MIRLAEALTALYGAARLARGNPDGIRFIDTSRAGAARSFWAAGLALPVALPLTLLRLSYFPPRADTLEIVAIEIIAYAVGWTAFPVIAHFAAQIAERGHRFTMLVATYNWASLFQICVLLVVTPVTLSGLLPSPLDSVVEIGLRLALIGYLAFAIRVALDVSWPAAAGLSLVEFVLGLSIFRTVLTLENAWPLPPGAA